MPNEPEQNEEDWTAYIGQQGFTRFVEDALERINRFSNNMLPDYFMSRMVTLSRDTVEEICNEEVESRLHLSGKRKG